jgi:hypothetical protein
MISRMADVTSVENRATRRTTSPGSGAGFPGAAGGIKPLGETVAAHPSFAPGGAVLIRTPVLTNSDTNRKFN